MTLPSTPTASSGEEARTRKPTLGRVVIDQKRVIGAAIILAVAGCWVLVPLGEWQAGVFLAGGILLGLANQLATEYSLLKMITSGAQLTRSEIAGKALVRLLVVTGVAVAVAVVFWSSGLVALIGLALFRLIALVMTSIPLLKELREP